MPEFKQEPVRKDIAHEVDRVRDFIKDIERIGVRVPALLKRHLNLLQIAANTSEDLVRSAEEASRSLAAFEKSLLDACRSNDEAKQTICEARVVRTSQIRAIQYTLDKNNPNSVASRMIINTINRYRPSTACRNWTECARGGPGPVVVPGPH